MLDTRVVAIEHARCSRAERKDEVSKIINCECGQVVRAETDDEIVANVEAHIERDHPDLVGKMSREDVLAMAEET